MKKLLLFISCAILSLSTIAANFTVDGIYYTISGSNVSVTSGGYTGAITIPASVTYNSITYPVTAIGNMAFASCSDLTSVSIPSSVTTIGDDAFYRCIGLTSLVIPTSVTSIGNYAFEYAGLTSITIPSSVSSIGQHAFNFCTSLKTVTIPVSVSSIGTEAFWACSALTSIYVNRSIPVDLTSSDNVFYGVNQTSCVLYVPVGAKTAYQAASQWKDFKNIVEFTTAVPRIDDERINIHPNPVVDKFKIDGLEGATELILMDINGKELLHKEILKDENVSVSEFPAGMYFVKLSNNGLNYKKKIIKK
ncbi:MAG: cell surface protein [Bacteroidetes bacterium]|nr:cell surface protein [Bacteroidota bacterium]